MYPHVATGFTDSNAYLRELTLKSMLVLAPKLSQKALNQSLLKYLAKLQARARARAGRSGGRQRGCVEHDHDPVTWDSSCRAGMGFLI